jgi:branched-chain amino acid transport system permease protein
MLTMLISGVATGCIYALVAIGFSMVYKAMDLVNFAQGDIMMLGAFFGFTLLGVFPGAPYLLILSGAVVGGALVGYLIERFALRPAVRRKAGQTYLVLLTLGIGMILSNGARLIWGANPVVYDIPLAHQLLRLGDVAFPAAYLYIGGAMVVILVALQLFFTRTWTGLTLRAAADDRESASLMGIAVVRSSSLSFVIASMLGAAAGVLYAPLYYVSFDMGLIGIKAFAAAALGGFGNLPGAVVGGLVIGIAEAYGGATIGNQYQDSIAFGSMILLLLFFPKGLLGKRRAA